MAYPTPLSYGPDHEPTHCEGCGSRLGDEPCDYDCPALEALVEESRRRIDRLEADEAGGGACAPYELARERAYLAGLVAMQEAGADGNCVVPPIEVYEDGRMG